MDAARSVSTEDTRVTIREINNSGPFSTLADDVRKGFSRSPKQLPPKYFYDDRGSRLFERICSAPEYYPTRTENALLEQKSASIIAHVKPSSILELGSGSSRKTTHLLNACDQQQCYSKYLPFDVCGDIMVSAGKHLTCRYDWLEVEAHVGDYCRDLPALPGDDGPRLVAFLGGTIGNFGEDEALAFLRGIHAIMRDEDRLLIGADRAKDTEVLHAAYNDAQGYTAAFNLNILEVINRELGAQFNLDLFEHHAFFNEPASRIEMHLRSKSDQMVYIRDLDMHVSFKRGETVLTEISRKFAPGALTHVLDQAGFVIERHFEPGNNYYSLILARPKSGTAARYQASPDRLAV